MKKLLIAVSAASVLLTAAACTDPSASATPTHHGKTHNTHKTSGSGGVITSMAYTQSMDNSRSCKHTPAQAECSPRWTIAYRDQAGKQHTASVTEAAYNRCLRRYPGGHYPACAH